MKGDKSFDEAKKVYFSISFDSGHDFVFLFRK